MKRLFLFAAIAALLCLPALAQYTYTAIDYPGSNLTNAFGINNRGQVVGSFRTTPPRHAFLWENGNFTVLDPTGVLGTNYSEANWINDHGDVAGLYIDPFGFEYGFIYSKGNVTSLNVPWANLGTVATAINNAGEVVGFYIDANTFNVHGFSYSGGVYSHLDVPGAVDTQPLGINDHGDISGDWDTDPTTFGHGFVLSKGKFTSYDHPNAAPDSTLLEGINNRRDTSGTYIDNSGNAHNFLLTKDGPQEVRFPVGDPGPLHGINDFGQVVGFYFLGPVHHGFIATPVSKGK